MKRIFLVKRKGFNFFTDFIELYLHKAFQSYGYSIVRNKNKSDFSVFVYMSDNEKHFKITSAFFDKLNENDALDLCQLFSSAFKSDVKMSETECDLLSSDYVYEFMLSKNFSAYDEPAFLTDCAPKLMVKTWQVYRTNTINQISFVNIGGGFSGVNFSFDFINCIEQLEVCGEVLYYNGKEDFRKPLVFEKDNDSFKAYADFLKMSGGINQESAVLRGKKRADEEERHGFRLMVVPSSKEELILKGKLTVSTGNIEIFKGDI